MPLGLVFAAVQVKIFEVSMSQSGSEWVLTWRAEVWENGQKVSGSDNLTYEWSWIQYTVGVGQTASDNDYNVYDTNYYISHLDGNLIKSTGYMTYDLTVDVVYNSILRSATFTIPENFGYYEPTVTVNYPTGTGVTWYKGFPQTIQWSFTDYNGSIDIDLSRNGGTSWENIVYTTADDGSYTYQVAGSVSTNCLIRVIDGVGNWMSDVSNNAFSLQEPPIPSVPQNLSLTGNYGDPPNITWSASTWATSYKVYRRRSYDNPSSFSQIGTTSNTNYTDNDIEITSKDDRDDGYQYKVKASNSTGDSGYSDYVFTWGAIVFKSVNDQQQISPQDQSILPEEFALNQNYPNPFNPATTINYQIPENAHVVVSVYNLKGQLVANLVAAQQSVGYHQITWDASNQPSGIYVVRMKAANFTAIQKLTLSK